MEEENQERIKMDIQRSSGYADQMVVRNKEINDSFWFEVAELSNKVNLNSYSQDVRQKIIKLKTDLLSAISDRNSNSHSRAMILHDFTFAITKLKI